MAGDVVMDETNLALLAELQRNARISHSELSRSCPSVGAGGRRAHPAPRGRRHHRRLPRRGRRRQARLADPRHRADALSWQPLRASRSQGARVAGGDLHRQGHGGCLLDPACHHADDRPLRIAHRSARPVRSTVEHDGPVQRVDVEAGDGAGGERRRVATTDSSGPRRSVGVVESFEAHVQALGWVGTGDEGPAAQPLVAGCPDAPVEQRQDGSDGEEAERAAVRNRQPVVTNLEAVAHAHPARRVVHRLDGAPDSRSATSQSLRIQADEPHHDVLGRVGTTDPWLARQPIVGRKISLAERQHGEDRRHCIGTERLAAGVVRRLPSTSK